MQQCSVCLWLWISAGVQSVHPGYKGPSVRGPGWADGGRHGWHLPRRGLVLKSPLAHCKKRPLKTEPDRNEREKKIIANKKKSNKRKHTTPRRVAQRMSDHSREMH